MGSFRVAFFEADYFEFCLGQLGGIGVNGDGRGDGNWRGGERTAFYAGDERIHDDSLARCCLSMRERVCVCGSVYESIAEV